MNATRLQQRLAARALARGRSLAEALATLNEATARTATTYAREGRLFEALRVLGHDRDVATAGAAWPSGLEPALRRLDAIPSRTLLLLPLAQASAYLCWVALFEGLVLVLLSQWVAPGLGALSALDGETVRRYGDASTGLLVVSALGLTLAGTVGAFDWARLAGWRRPLERARALGILAGLEEARAPADVRRAWARRVWAVDEGQEPLPEALDAGVRIGDLDVLRVDAVARAQRVLERFVGTYRVVGAALLTLVALLVTLDVYGAVASLARLP